MAKISLSLLSLLLYASFGIMAINADSDSDSSSDSDSGSNETQQTWPKPQGYNKYNNPAYQYPVYPYGGYYPQLAPAHYSSYPYMNQPPPPYPYPYGGYYGQPPQPAGVYPAPMPAQRPYEQPGVAPAPTQGTYQQPETAPSQGVPGFPGATSTINHSLKVNKEYKEDGHHTNA